jgi:formylmethanofuran dehydrogenase subunit D
MKMLLNTIRLMERDQAKELAIGSKETLKEKVAFAKINPKDFESLNLVPSLKLRIFNDGGEINVPFIQDENIPQGTIVMPVSIWSNQLTALKNGKLHNKNLTVEVEGTRDSPLSFEQIIKKIKEGA